MGAEAGRGQVDRYWHTLLASYFKGDRSWRDLVRGLGSFRNDVMHPVREFHEASTQGIRKLIDYDDRLRFLIAGASRCLAARTTDGVDPIVSDVLARF
jgi:hypothetical protein